ncbi:MAG TPA: SRPBCC family protein [Acidimicrobiales bacterium]|nr:SRPBCC family protein [Acidimicrobiales bacterium]
MKTETSIAIDAAAEVVWQVFTDVERWPEWTESVTRIVPLDGPAIEVGNRFEIKQPRMPKLVWQVTAVDPGRGWTWVQRSPGGTTLATHEVIAQGAQRTLVRQGIDQRGPVGTLVGALMRGTTRRYLQMEADGLKARSEARHRHDGATA